MKTPSIPPTRILETKMIAFLGLTGVSGTSALPSKVTTEVFSGSIRSKLRKLS
jgi:hypothetical protein